MPKLFGYIRVSTDKQNYQRQFYLLEQSKFKFDEIFADTSTGSNTNRPQFQEMIEALNDSDIVVTTSFDRISRSVKDLLTLTDIFQKKGVKFISLKEQLDTTTPQGEFMLTVFAAMNQLERRLISERTKEKMAQLKASGIKVGRKPRAKANPGKVRLVKHLRKQGLKIREIVEETGLSRSSVYHYLNTELSS